MTDFPGFASAIGAALSYAEMRAAAAIAAEVPADVAVSVAEGGIRLVGRALSQRSLTDARLRDFAGFVR